MKQFWNAIAVLAVLTVAPHAAATVPTAGQEQRIAIEVTRKGFEPATVHVRAGRPVVLVVTRRVEKTCAKEIVINARNVRQALPLDQAVEIRLNSKKPGTLRYACGMDMLAGTLVFDR